MTPSRLAAPLPLPAVLFALLVAGSWSLPGDAAAVDLDPGTRFTSELDLEPLPESGFLAVWQRDVVEPLSFGPDACRHREAAGAVLDDRGLPVAGPQALVFEGDAETPTALRVAAAPLRSAYFTVLAYTTAAGLKVADLTGDFQVRSPALVSSCTVHRFDLVSSGLGFWLVWDESCGERRIRARRISIEGQPQGPAVAVAEGTLAGPAHGFAAAPAAEGGFFAAWVERESSTFGDGRRVVAARFAGDGTRATEVSTVSDLLLSSGAPASSIAAATLATPPEGRFVVAWRDETGTIRLRSFSAAMEPLAATHAADGELGRGERPLLARSPHGPLVVAWDRTTIGPDAFDCPVRAFDADLEPLGPPAGLGGGCDRPEALAVSELTRLPLAARSTSDAPTSVCAAVDLAESSPPGLPPAPPAEGFVDAPELPGFLFYVRIGGDTADPRFGRREPACLPETVCVSGAVPGRTEVLLRIVGPKPNGFLWPTIVRFTTAQVEVWIEQLATGEVEYYRLDAATPGSETLDGLFDRTGFRP